MTKYKCPFSYIGSKSQLLPVLLGIFEPFQDDTFVDLFAGGFSVGVNVKNKNVIYNDINEDLMKLIKLLGKLEFEVFEKKIFSLIDEYKLDKSNSEAFLKLRSDFNRKNDSYLFALLIFYSFNHQIRYNKMGKFNTPFGKNRSSYNDNTKKNLKIFFSLLHNKNIEFLSKDFKEIEISQNSIVYVDPPYLITTGSYNDGDRGISSWDIKKEKELYDYLDNLNKRKIRFVLSNMVVNGSNKNDLLENWSRKYNVIEVDTKYKNYNRINKIIKEIIVKNF